MIVYEDDRIAACADRGFGDAPDGDLRGGGLSLRLVLFGLPAFGAVIDVPVLNHAVSPVTGYDDMIEN